jgi:hypothetical protein
VRVSKLRSKVMNWRMRSTAASSGIAYSAATIVRYSRPVSDSKTAPDSGTKPTCRFTSIGSRARSNPAMVAAPLVGSTMPVSILSVVDLPAPFAAEEADDLAAGNVEAELIHGDLCAVSLHRRVHRDHGATYRE